MQYVNTVCMRQISGKNHVHITVRLRILRLFYQYGVRCGCFSPAGIAEAQVIYHEHEMLKPMKKRKRREYNSPSEEESDAEPMVQFFFFFKWMSLLCLMCILSLSFLMQWNELVWLKEEKVEALKMDDRQNKAGTSSHSHDIHSNCFTKPSLMN